MSEQIQLLVVFLLYLAIFGWIGRQYGKTRIQLLLIVAIVSYVLIIPQNLIIRVANLGGKFAAFLQAGGLGEDTAAAFEAVGNAPDLVPIAAQDLFKFLVWIAVLIIATLIIYWRVEPGSMKADAFLWGMGGGILFAWCMLPLALRVFAPEGVIFPERLAGEPPNPSLNRMAGVLWGATIDSFNTLDAYLDYIFSVFGLPRPSYFWSYVILLLVLGVFMLIYRNQDPGDGFPWAKVIQITAIVIVIYLIIDTFVGSGGVKIW